MICLQFKKQQHYISVQIKQRILTTRGLQCFQIKGFPNSLDVNVNFIMLEICDDIFKAEFQKTQFRGSCFLLLCFYSCLYIQRYVFDLF